MMKPSANHLPSLLSALLFILAAMLFLSAALVTGVNLLSSLLTRESVKAPQTIVVIIALFEALLLIIAAFMAIQRYRQQPFAEQDISFSMRPWQVVVSLLVTAIVIFIGYRIGTNSAFNWLLLPVLTLPAVALPILVLLGFAIRGISLGARWQSWSIFGIAMTLVPFFLIFLEGIALVLVLFFAGIFLLSQPDLVRELQQLSYQIYLLGPTSEEIQNLLLPYISRPGVLATALFYVAFLVPLMEELLKPLGVWLFANKLTSPSQSFALGALSGAAYALIETLGVSAQSEDWASVLLLRIGTGMLHITSTALMGVAIFYVIRERRYVRLLGIYFLSILLHGLWNTVALLYGFSTITKLLGQKTFLDGVQPQLLMGMGILGVIFLAILLLLNRRLRTTLPQPVVNETMS
ncbi:MAG TPA: PrsW family glutamic-type intramembrane protease [Anaerolineales bacterium]|nr:PrsW family glutamic-type intramembrane protease [Anaerolineales bacterium]